MGTKKWIMLYFKSEKWSEKTFKQKTKSLSLCKVKIAGIEAHEIVPCHQELFFRYLARIYSLRPNLISFFVLTRSSTNFVKVYKGLLEIGIGTLAAARWQRFKKHGRILKSVKNRKIFLRWTDSSGHSYNFCMKRAAICFVLRNSKTTNKQLYS